MSLYDEMQFEVSDAPKDPRNRFDDLADALRSLPPDKYIRILFLPEVSTANQRQQLRIAMRNRGIEIETRAGDTGIYLRVSHFISLTDPNITAAAKSQS